ncbi:hypothetical protein DFH94DRAFT_25050 [Russula ochroleuca]|uniref:Uncharacterized protein n=1 Tax=Russula ochroleuca TaxID=152965 RepID=A0A9P5TE45_9AGAM|nr:hypothetical protein DFH94DRAFT_25050 [Russula ochroleuca]
MRCKKNALVNGGEPKLGARSSWSEAGRPWKDSNSGTGSAMPRWYTAEFTIKVIKAPAGEKGFCYPSHMINLDVDKEGVQCGKVLHYLKTNVTVNLWRMSSTSSMFARFLLQLCTRPSFSTLCLLIYISRLYAGLADYFRPITEPYFAAYSANAARKSSKHHPRSAFPIESFLQAIPNVGVEAYFVRKFMRLVTPLWIGTDA